MRKSERVPRALLEEVYTQGLRLGEAVEKVCAHPSLREALVLELGNRPFVPKNSC